MNHTFEWGLTIIGGIFLAVMISLNSQLAAHSSPFIASWFAHGIGAVVALLLLQTLALIKKNKRPDSKHQKAPFWSYLGGVPGAFIVAFAAITVNSPLGLSGTLVLTIVGQTVFGLVGDHFGFFGLKRRPMTRKSIISISCILTGSLLLIFS